MWVNTKVKLEAKNNQIKRRSQKLLVLDACSSERLVGWMLVSLFSVSVESDFTPSGKVPIS
ncbi:hypothetical protein ES703_111269 [subsurface metagenome]